jgi:hypothetical protein
MSVILHPPHTLYIADQLFPFLVTLFVSVHHTWWVRLLEPWWVRWFKPPV